MSMELDVGKVEKGLSSAVDLSWEISYALLQPQRINYAVVSPEFRVAGAKWQLSMWPYGTDETAGWTELWLEKTDATCLDLRVRWEMGIRCHDGTTFRSQTGEQRLEGKFAKCGEIMLLRYSELHAKRDVVAPHGVVTVFCDLRIDGETGVDASCQTDQTEPQGSADKVIDGLKENSNF